ncbi:MAG: amidohydrolase family protein [Acidobacteriota bacterium]|nr:amidohydrolase family protein [Acidobacteriota bacterium]
MRIPWIRREARFTGIHPGRPTGILIDSAIPLVEREIPPLDPDARLRALETAARHLVAAGLATVHDMGVDEPTWQAMVRLAGEGRFPLRVFAYAQAGGRLHRRLVEDGPITEGRLHLVGVKFYADGALGSRGARLAAPYSDQGNTRGLWVTDPAALRAGIDEALRAGLQPAVHAIGDEANRVVIDLFIEALAALGRRPTLPPRLEHAQIVDPADIRRAAEAGIVISMQPTHATSDMPWVEQRLGPERLAGAYAWKRFLDAGARLAFGSDFPVESIDPRRGLYAAVTRQDALGRPPGGWLPDQRLELSTALAAMTSGAAAAVGREKVLGRLVVGASCDLTVLERDPFREPPRALLDNGVTATVIEGHVFSPVIARAQTP